MNMLKLLVGLVTVIFISVSGAHGWTNHPFHVEKDSVGEWYVTTFTEELRTEYFKGWKSGKINVVSIKYVKGKEPTIHLIKFVDPIIVSLVTVYLEDFVAVVKREMPELKQLVLSFYYPIMEISSHTYREAFKDIELHIKLAEVLNEQRRKVRGK